MRSLWSKMMEFWRTEGGRPSSSQPEALRRHAIATIARLVTALSIVGMPVALFGLMLNMLLPVLVGLVGAAVGVTSLVFCRRGQFERAAATQVYATLLIGSLLTIPDPGLVDLGLAVALLAPIQATLLTRTAVQKRAWAILVAVFAVAALSNIGLLGWPEPFRVEFFVLSAAAYVVTAGTIIYAAACLSSVFEVYEKGQLNAFRHLIENVQDAVMRFGSDGKVLFTSRSSEKLLGCRRFELGGEGLIERIHVLDRPSYMTAFAEANQDGKARRVEIRMRRDDIGAPAAAPQYIWVEVSLSPVTDRVESAGRFEVVLLLRDVTERHDRENELRRARKLAEEASSAKSRFLATIGHELRTPLNAIVGFSEMMTSGVVGELSPQHKEYATLIHQSGHHLIEVVKMLLDMSRIEAGRFELVTEQFSPEGLVEPCLRMVDAMAREKSLRLTSDISRNLPVIVADERACRQILINLLSNAIKFSHERSVVTVSMKRQGRYLAVAVTDHGIGMGEESLNRVGEPFFQVQDGLARRYEGTGLGLSIVKGLVELHGGTLHASSVPGEGTVMTVLLPINGPETKLVDTPVVTPLHREPALQQMPTWHADERKRAL